MGTPGPGTGRRAPRQSACRSGHVGDPWESVGPLSRSQTRGGPRHWRGGRRARAGGPSCRPGRSPVPRSWWRTGRAWAGPGASVPTFRTAGLLLRSWPPNLRVSVVHPRDHTGHSGKSAWHADTLQTALGCTSGSSRPVSVLKSEPRRGEYVGPLGGGALRRGWCPQKEAPQSSLAPSAT